MLLLIFLLCLKETAPWSCLWGLRAALWCFPVVLLWFGEGGDIADEFLHGPHAALSVVIGSTVDFLVISLSELLSLLLLITNWPFGGVQLLWRDESPSAAWLKRGLGAYGQHIPEGAGVSAPTLLRCFGDLSAGVLCSQILKAFAPKRHRGWRKPQIKMLPFHGVSKQLVLKRSYEITELLCGAACGDLPGKRCSCPTYETIQILSPLMLCWERAKKKRNLFNSIFWTLFSAGQHLLIFLFCVEWSFFSLISSWDLAYTYGFLYS